MPDTHEAFREEYATGSDARIWSCDKAVSFCSLWSAESRQRKVTWPSAMETRRWLEAMATRWSVAAEIVQHHIRGTPKGRFK